MNLELTEEQQMIRRTARDYATRVLAPRAAARDIDGTFPEEELRALAGLGLLGVAVPEELGGSGVGAVAYSLVMQELARADASVAVAVSVTNMVAELHQPRRHRAAEARARAQAGERRVRVRRVRAVRAAVRLGRVAHDHDRDPHRRGLALARDQAVDHRR